MGEFWVLLALLAAATAQSNHDPAYLTQDSYQEPDESSYHQYQNEYSRPRTYEPSYDEPKHYQSVEASYPKPEFGGYPSHTSYYSVPQQAQSYDSQSPAYQLSYDKSEPQVPSYDKSEDVSSQRELLQLHRPQASPQQDLPSYKRLRDIAYQKSGSPDHDDYSPSGKEGEEHRYAPEPADQKLPSYNTLKDIAYQKSGSSDHDEPDDYRPPVQDGGDHQYAPAPVRSASKHHPAPVPVDPKLPLYFTMYEKRIIADPTDKYGKGPWRYLTYGHGITYGSKEPGKVFEKGYGYIRALGRDVCKLPEQLCPPKDGKPFEYEGRKEPYFGYRPH